VHFARVSLVAFALAALSAGCRKDPVLRLTYRVDVAAAYDGEKDKDAMMTQARDTIARRLDAFVGARSFSISTRGSDLLVDLAALDPHTPLQGVKAIIARSGRLELKMVDDRASESIFGSSLDLSGAPGEGIETYQEAAPDGLDADGGKTTVKSFFARMSCQPRKHPSESSEECLDRFRAWASGLKVPADHQIGFEAITEAVPDTEPPRFRQTGWRTMYMQLRAELTHTSVEDVAIGQDQGSGGYYLLLSWSSTGAERLEEITAANVNRRFAMVIERDIVESAPVIKQTIPGGKATITMGPGAPEKQLRDAKQLELVLKEGALPAPVHLVNEEAIRAGAR
jgi:preprotein translocase subunit SecD